MDSTDNETGYLTEDNIIVGDKGDRYWHNRLRLRKAAVQPPAMQSGDKRGSKTMIADQEQRPEQTRPEKTQQSRHVAKVPGDVLSFRCTECQDKREFSPHDLLRHFQEKHRGSTPFFSCDMCTYNTHKVSCLQVHILGHMDTFASCIICNDNVKRTLLELTAHLDMHHRVNGFYSCERCTFSVSDVGAFVEHMHLHGLTPCDNGSHSGCNDVQSHTEPIPMATHLPFRCPLCDYETPLKDIIAKHMVTVHGDERCRTAKRRVKAIRHNLGDSSPRLRRRWRGSMTKEMHWMSQDCLSVPGREFLERYCNLSGSEKALEEAQHLLERSVAAESGGENWTKALQTVLSNVPQDIAHFSVLGSGTTTNPILPNTGNDLTVLTVKNKISVPQNGSVEAIGLKTVEGRRNMVSKVMPPGKLSLTIPSETFPEDSHGAADTQRSQSNLNISPQTQHNSQPGSLLLRNNVATTSLPNAGCNQSQENGESQRMRPVQEDHGEQARQREVSENANHCEDEGGFIELKLRKERSENEEKSPLETRPCLKNKKRRRKAFRPKIVNKPSPGLKLFLKKDPVKERQWTSQCPFPVMGGGLLEDYQSLPPPQRTLEETQLFLQRALSEENGVKKWTKATKTGQENVPKATTPAPQSKPEEGPVPNPGYFSSTVSGLMAQNKTSAPPACTTNVMSFKMADGKGRLVVLSEQETHDSTEEPLLPMETEVDDAMSECCTGNLSSAEDKGLTNSDFPLGALINSDPQSPVENIPLQNITFNPENMREVNQVEKDGFYSSIEGTQAPVVTTPVTPTLQFLSLPQGMTNLPRDPDHTTHVSTRQQDEHEVTGRRRGEASSDNCPRSSPVMVREAGQVSVCRWEPAPKHVERTLKLQPATPTQLVKCPDGDQPVVVLNHPDVDIPEVTNIMDIVHRYKRDVQKVVLSQTTLNALLALDGKPVGGSDPAEPHGAPQQPGRPENSAKERFVLKLKLKKTSEKKYKVVDVVPPPPVRYSCWFCGRVFSTQEMWISHGQRHLVAWKRPSCET